MTNLFDKIKQNFNKSNTTSSTLKQTSTETKPQYSFIKQYTLLDPNKVLCNYSHFFGCEKIPVAYEDNDTNSMFKTCLELPNKDVFREYLTYLYKSKLDIADMRKALTIFIIDLAPGKQLYILPNLLHIKNPTLVFSFDKESEKNGVTADKYWPFFMTPQIRRATVDTLKYYTR